MNAWVRVLIVVQITINTSAPSPHDSRHGKFVAGATDQGIEEEFNAFMEQVDDKDNILNLEHRYDQTYILQGEPLAGSPLPARFLPTPRPKPTPRAKYTPGRTPKQVVLSKPGPKAAPAETTAVAAPKQTPARTPAKKIPAARKTPAPKKAPAQPTAPVHRPDRTPTAAYPPPTPYTPRAPVSRRPQSIRGPHVSGPHISGPHISGPPRNTIRYRWEHGRNWELASQVGEKQ